jgi:hypothetical protein
VLKLLWGKHCVAFTVLQERFKTQCSTQQICPQNHAPTDEKLCDECATQELKSV